MILNTVIYNKQSGEIVSTGYISSDRIYSKESLQPEDQKLDILLEFSQGSLYQYVKDGILTNYTLEQIALKQNRPLLPVEWSNETFTWTPINIRSLQELKQDRKNQITVLRETKNQEPITYQNSLFDCDETAQRNIQAWTTNINAGTNPPAGFVWRDYNNVDHPADVDFILGLNAAVVARGTQLYQTSWTKKSEIDALTTAEAVNAYDITTGW